MQDDGPKAEIKDGKIYLEGVDQELEIAEHQSLRVTVSGLRKARTAQVISGKLLDDTRIYGTGKLDGTIGVKMVQLAVAPYPLHASVSEGESHASAVLR